MSMNSAIPPSFTVVMVMPPPGTPANAVVKVSELANSGFISNEASRKF